MKKKFFSLLFVSFSLFPLLSWALVDYTESSTKDEIRVGPNQKTPSQRSTTKLVRRAAPRTSSSAGGSSAIELGGFYSSMDVKEDNKRATVSIYDVRAHFQTAYNVFLDASMWIAGSDNGEVGEGKSDLA